MSEKYKTRPDTMEFGQKEKFGLAVNLLYADLPAAINFQTEILNASCLWREEHFAVMEFAGTRWLLHSDFSYRDHEFIGSIQGLEARGGGVELRLTGLDPDATETRARAADAFILSGAANKPRGQREVHLMDGEGYVWVAAIAWDGEE